MSRRTPLSRRAMLGLSLVELLVSLALGLLVTGGAITVFISNRQTYRATENLARLQENSRIAYELMARDLREAGGNPCEEDLPLVNVLSNADAVWWSTWGTRVRGYGTTTAFGDAPFGNGAGQRVSGTSAIEVVAALSDGVGVASHVPTTATMTFNTTTHGFVTGDIVMVCDFTQAAIFQISNATAGSAVVRHQTGTVTPGNALACLALEGTPGCPPPGPYSRYAFGCYDGRYTGSACQETRNWPATIGRFTAFRWYVGNNGRGGRSLYRTGLVNTAGVVAPTNVEIAENVSDMQIQYLLTNATAYVEAAAVGDWRQVRAARVTLTVQGPDQNIASGGGPLSHTVQHTVVFRNRAG